MQYAIPEILIEPQLSFCQKSMLDMARAIIDCEKQISGKRDEERPSPHPHSLCSQKRLVSLRTRNVIYRR